MSAPSLLGQAHGSPRRPWIPVLALCATLACVSTPGTVGTGGAASSPDDSTKALSSRFTGDVLDPLDPGESEEDSIPAGSPTGLRGELFHDTTYYKAHPDEFYQQMRPLGWHGRRRKRKCKDPVGSTECQAGRKTGEMIVQAIEDASAVKVDVQTRNPVVIGRVMNTGGLDDAVLPVAPARQGYPPDQYYFIVERGTPDKAKLMVARLQLTANGRTATAMSLYLAPEGYIKCRHPEADPPRKRGMADFRTCPGRREPEHHSHGSNGSERRARADAASALAWFSCDGGCCSAQWPP